MRTVIRFGALALTIAAASGTWWLRTAGATDVVAIHPDVGVMGATPEQLAMARWAMGRFDIAGLEPPAVDIAFHGDRAGCGSHLGMARAGRVDVCTVLANEMARRTLLHEMGHIWIDQNVSQPVRERFLALRGLRTWNASTDPWEERGYEQGAEIMAWALGNRILSAQIPYSEFEDLDVAFQLLTGVEVSFADGAKGRDQAPTDARRGR
ncbi:MAG: hypothetical protein L0206_11950 [Actinobacteria bacterium]|nr:hypothetical protein [Actinomycetota bacterium]